MSWKWVWSKATFPLIWIPTPPSRVKAQLLLYPSLPHSFFPQKSFQARSLSIQLSSLPDLFPHPIPPQPSHSGSVSVTALLQRSSPSSPWFTHLEAASPTPRLKTKYPRQPSRPPDSSSPNLACHTMWQPHSSLLGLGPSTWILPGHAFLEISSYGPAPHSTCS